jgi:hypothetical protein
MKAALEKERKDAEKMKQDMLDQQKKLAEATQKVCAIFVFCAALSCLLAVPLFCGLIDCRVRVAAQAAAAAAAAAAASSKPGTAALIPQTCMCSRLLNV